MQYKVIPFVAKINRTDTTGAVANQLQSMIDTQVASGWEYYRMEIVETSVAPTSGCFGLGAQAGFTTAFQVLVFKKE